MLQNETMDLAEWSQRESADDGFDWGASTVTAVIRVISRAAVQMSVFTRSEAKPALCEPTLIDSSQK